MTNDIASELAKLHELTGAEFSRQVERIAKRKEFHPLETDKDILTTGGKQSDDYENLLQAARKAVELDIGFIFFQIRQRYEPQTLSLRRRILLEYMT